MIKYKIPEESIRIDGTLDIDTIKIRVSLKFIDNNIFNKIEQIFNKYCFSINNGCYIVFRYDDQNKLYLSYSVGLARRLNGLDNDIQKTLIETESLFDLDDLQHKANLKCPDKCPDVKYTPSNTVLKDIYDILGE